MCMKEHLSLYMFSSCPFYQRVNLFLKLHNIQLEKRNIRENINYREELIAGGGKGQIPCLRIEHAVDDIEWLYESADIIDYLAEHFKVN